MRLVTLMRLVAGIRLVTGMRLVTGIHDEFDFSVGSHWSSHDGRKASQCTPTQPVKELAT